MRWLRVRSRTTTSRAGHLVCPACGCGTLRPRRLLSRRAECEFCEGVFDTLIVRTLKQIVALPDALGKHPCECGYPEMRYLPDGVFHCPACRSEVLPLSIPASRGMSARKSSLAPSRG